MKGEPKRFIRGHGHHFPKGKDNPRYNIGILNGGFTIRGRGNLYKRAIINCRDGTQILWSRIVYSNYFLGGIELSPKMVVHHINQDPSDDRPNNLQLMSLSKHTGYHNSKNKNGSKAVLLIKDCAIMQFNSAKEASLSLNLDRRAVDTAIRYKHKIKGWLPYYL